MLLEPHKTQVARALSTLDHSLKRLTEALTHRPAEFLQVAGHTNARAALLAVGEAYATIDYNVEDAVNQSPVCLGVIGVNADVLKAAAAVNAAKAAFKAVAAPLQRVSTRIPVKGEAARTRAVPLIRVILRNLQRSDLNLLAAYRKIPILGAPPTSVTYVRARTRAVYRKTVEEIATMLIGQDGPQASRDRARLESLSPQDTHLALVRDHYDNIRANVVYERLDKRGRGRVQVSAELPLLYAQGRHPSEPEVQFPDPTGEGDIKARKPRTSKLEPQPFLRTLPVYRYAMPDLC